VAKAMTKTEVIKELATKVKVDRKTAVAFMEQVVALAVKETKKNGQFQIPGLGKPSRRIARLAWAAILRPARPSRSRRRPL